MNTRLQVEHPVTEAVTGLDLVRLQIHVAEGDVLPARGHGARPERPRDRGAPLRGGPRQRLPARAGALHRFRVPAGPGLRVDAGVADGSVVGPHYDSLLAKVIAHAPTRAEAAARLAGVAVERCASTAS